jgi:hypothetical protein
MMGAHVYPDFRERRLLQQAVSSALKGTPD